MATRSLTLELDELTLEWLEHLGPPSEVLAGLARAAAEGDRARPVIEQRQHTDDSLQDERDSADSRAAQVLEAEDLQADDVVRLARRRADQVVQTAEGIWSTPTTTTEVRRAALRTALEQERSTADALLSQERHDRRRGRASDLLEARGTTDKNLGGERAQADTVLVDQREVNAQLVSATIRAHELADEADEAKTRSEDSERELRAIAEFREMFIGIVGHDLRAPLTSIVTAAALLLRRGHLDALDSEIAARIIRSSQRIARMITQLLDLTRARLGGGLPIEATPGDLGDLCRNVVEEFEAPIELAIEGDVAGSWDGDRLAEALSNLLGNAIEHATGGTAVTVIARDDGPWVVVEIRNQGPPIAPEILPFIFEPFRRAKQHEKSSTGNLGLGLYIAKEIVLSHGGTLDAESADGETTFHLRLPRTPADARPTH